MTPHVSSGDIVDWIGLQTRTLHYGSPDVAALFVIAVSRFLHARQEGKLSISSRYQAAAGRAVRMLMSRVDGQGQVTIDREPVSGERERRGRERERKGKTRKETKKERKMRILQWQSQHRPIAPRVCVNVLCARTKQHAHRDWCNHGRIREGDRARNFERGTVAGALCRVMFSHATALVRPLHPGCFLPSAARARVRDTHCCTCCSSAP